MIYLRLNTVSAFPMGLGRLDLPYLSAIFVLSPRREQHCAKMYDVTKIVLINIHDMLWRLLSSVYRHFVEGTLARPRFRCWWTDFVPEAIHNPVGLAIKLLVSGLLT